jgi:hypothetical protein
MIRASLFLTFPNCFPAVANAGASDGSAVSCISGYRDLLAGGGGTRCLRLGRLADKSELYLTT